MRCDVVAYVMATTKPSTSESKISNESFLSLLITTHEMLNISESTLHTLIHSYSLQCWFMSTGDNQTHSMLDS